MTTAGWMLFWHTRAQVGPFERKYTHGDRCKTRFPGLKKQQHYFYCRHFNDILLSSQKANLRRTLRPTWSRKRMWAPARTDWHLGPGYCLRARCPPAPRWAAGAACVTEPRIVISGVRRRPPPPQVRSDIFSSRPLEVSAKLVVILYKMHIVLLTRIHVSFKIKP